MDQQPLIKVDSPAGGRWCSSHAQGRIRKREDLHTPLHLYMHYMYYVYIYIYIYIYISIYHIQYPLKTLYTIDIRRNYITTICPEIMFLKRKYAAHRGTLTLKLEDIKKCHRRNGKSRMIFMCSSMSSTIAKISSDII